jgi:transposase
LSDTHGTADGRKPVFAAERRQRILDLVRANGAVSLRELAQAVQSSEVTVRRDVRTLEAAGLLNRHHGGASLPGELSREPTYLQKAQVAPAEKAAIAELATSLVEDGDAIVIGPGTTTQAFAQRLGKHTELAVVTNSLLVAQALAGSPRIEVVLTGGTLRGSIHALVGSAAERSLAGLRVRRTVDTERAGREHRPGARGGGRRGRRARGPHEDRRGHHGADRAGRTDRPSGHRGRRRAGGARRAGRPGCPLARRQILTPLLKPLLRPLLTDAGRIRRTPHRWAHGRTDVTGPFRHQITGQGR